MTTHAAARQKMRVTESAPAQQWTLKISSPNQNLAILNNVECQITRSMPGPNAQPTEIQGSVFTTAGPIPFSGYYESNQVISFSLILNGVPYTFFGVFSTTVKASMGGIILAPGLGSDTDGSEDEGSWSSQARPTEDEDCSRRKPAAPKGRA